MNPYPLSKGINKLFFGELLTCMSSVVSFSIVLLSMLFLGSKNHSDYVSISIVLISVSIIVVVLSFVGLILMVLGVKQLSQENDSLKKAFYGFLIMIIVSMLASFFTNQEVALLLNEIPQIINVFVTVYILKGLIEILHEIKETQLEMRIRKQISIILAIFGIICACDLLVNTIESAQVVIILSSLMILLDIIGYCLLLLILAKTKAVFKNLMMD